MGDAEKWVQDALDARRADHGLRPPRLPRRGSALARAASDRAASSGSPQIEVAEELEEAALRGAAASVIRSAPLETNVEYYSAVVLDIAEIPPPLAPGDVRLLARRRLVGAHPRAEAHRAAVPAVGALRRPGAALAPSVARDARGGGRRRRTRSPRTGKERELADAAARVGRRARGRRARAGLPRAGGRLPRDRAVPVPAEDRAAAAAGSTTRARPAAARR